MAAHDPQVRRQAARTASHARLAPLDAEGRRRLTSRAREVMRQKESEAVQAEAEARGEQLDADTIAQRVAERRRQRMSTISRLGVQTRQRQADERANQRGAA